MKALYLVRHAKAVSRDLSIPDRERRLRPRGRHEAQQMARHIQGLLPAPDIILSSPVPRALETAQIFAQAYGYGTHDVTTDTSIYDEADQADAMTFLRLLHKLDTTVCTVMLVGHDPLCSAFAHFLCHAFTASMPTGAVVYFTLAIDKWTEAKRNCGQAIWFYTPKTLGVANAPGQPATSLSGTGQPYSGQSAPTDTPAAMPPIGTAPLTYVAPPQFQLTALSSALQSDYTIGREPRRRETSTLYDTFDWRLFNKSLLLSCSDTQAELQALDDGRPLCRAALTTTPALADALPPGNLQQRLAPILGLRSLIPLLSRSVQTDTIRVLDDEAKTVLRLIIEQHLCTRDHNDVTLPIQVHLKPVRGYSKSAVKMHKWLLRHGLRPASEASAIQALKAVGQSPNNYIAKPQLPFDPGMPSDQAARQLLLFLLDVMQRNKDGILQDIDSEFLHDFRVAIRRTRSALGQLKGVFPADATRRFRQHFARLAAMTSTQRDLDVYLLQQDAYKAKLPTHLRANIEPLFADLQRRRSRAHTALKRQLQGKTVATILDTWAAFLHAPPQRSDTAPHAATPIATLAQKRVRKKCRTVVALGQKLLQSPDDEQLHALRIECKKLRYLLEFFASLFPTSQIDPLLKQLRKLQDNLGDFNDICIQQNALHEMSEQFDAPAQRPTLRAIDCLIGLLDLDKQERRDAFAKCFTSFARSVKRVGRLKAIR